LKGKLHEIQGQKIVACCDKELVGKVIKGGGAEVEARKEFYGDSVVDERWLDASLGEAANANLLGEKVVGAAIKMGYIKNEDVIKLAGVPHAQIFRI